MKKQKIRRLIKNFSNMSLRGMWRKATCLPNGVGESKFYGIDFILIVSLFSLFRRRFQTDGHLVVQSTPISPYLGLIGNLYCDDLIACFLFVIVHRSVSDSMLGV